MLAGLIEIVEGVGKLLLNADFSRDELNIVHKEQIDIAILVAELLLSVVLDGLNHLIYKVVAFYISDFEEESLSCIF